MLEPGSRSHLMELLRPPNGCNFDSAVGTTYSLDLMSALMLPLSFVFFDWEREDGELSDPLALLEALQLNGDRFSVFCQAGNIRLPKGKYSRLLTFLEPCVHEVRPPDRKGVFHPKVWAVRYVNEDGTIHYRVLCLSRNLTFDRSWDTVVALDGILSSRKTPIPANRPLAEFIRALPGLCLHSLPAARKKAVAKIADELLRVRFEWPEGFEDEQCRFWTSGLDGKRIEPFEKYRQDCLIVSPFVSESVIRNFVENSRQVHLVSREESLQAIPLEILQNCESIHCLSPQLGEEETEDVQIPETNEVLEGLHAKLFVIDHGTKSHVFSGSFNATHHAFNHNVEFMVEMVGKRKDVGVDRFLDEEKGSSKFADLLQPYSLDTTVSAVDPLMQEFDDLFRLIKNAIFDALPSFHVSRSKSPDLFELRIEWKKRLNLPDPRVRMKVWPITLPRERALIIARDATHWEVSYEGITPLLAISLECEIDKVRRESTFVMNIPLEGAPLDRHDRVVASLLEGKEQLLRYILFLLAAGDEEAATSGELARMLMGGNNPSELLLSMPSLLETMLRALHRGPEQMKRVATLLDSLKRCGKGAEFVGEDFQSIWGPIWEVASQIKPRK